ARGRPRLPALAVVRAAAATHGAADGASRGDLQRQRREPAGGAVVRLDPVVALAQLRPQAGAAPRVAGRPGRAARRAAAPPPAGRAVPRRPGAARRGLTARPAGWLSAALRSPRARRAAPRRAGAPPARSPAARARR